MTPAISSFDKYVIDLLAEMYKITSINQHISPLDSSLILCVAERFGLPIGRIYEIFYNNYDYYMELIND